MNRGSHGPAFGSFLLVIGAVVIGLSVGPAGIGPVDLWEAVREGTEPGRTVLLDLRLPRVTAALLVGASLAVSGALFQALVRNPLAEPYLLGVSAGAALGAVVAIGAGWAGAGSAILPLAALGGALAAIVIVFRVAWVADSGLDTRVLLLAGVVTSAFFSACVLLVITFLGPRSFRSAVFWTLGSLSGASWPATAVLAAYALPASVVAFGMSRHLNALSIGEETAASLGTEVERMKLVVYLLASLLAAAAVAVAGVIGFVGLVIPHAVRLVWGADHRQLIPLCILLGGGVLVLMDTAARTVASPLEVPVGVITALLGVPVFLLMLRRRTGP